MTFMAMRVHDRNSHREINILAAYQNQVVLGCGPRAIAVHRHVSKYVFKIIGIQRLLAMYMLSTSLQDPPLPSAPIPIYTFILLDRL